MEYINPARVQVTGGKYMVTGVLPEGEVRMEYIHDEWCGTKIGTWPEGELECDCVVGTLKAKDEEIQYLKDMGEIMLAVIKKLKEGYDERA